MRALGAALVLPAVSHRVTADPFQPDNSIALGALTSAGGLALRVPVFVVRLEHGYSIDVALEHETPVHDYRDTASTFRLVPCMSAVWTETPGRFRWQRPGGGFRLFSQSDRVSEAEARRDYRFAPSDIALLGLTLFHRNGGILSMSDHSGSCYEIVEDNWCLRYQSGLLVFFRTPDGDEYEVKARGGMIAAIFHRGVTLAEFEWRADQQPALAKSGSESFALSYDTDHRLQTVSNMTSGAPHANCAYRDNLLSKLSTASSTIHIGWLPPEPRREPTRNRVSILQSVDDIQYEYRETDDYTIMKETKADGHYRRMEIRKRFGAVIGIQQQDR